MADVERGERIKTLREARPGFTQEAAAEAIGVTLRAYQAWEAGGGIKWDNVKLIAALYDVEPEYLWEKSPEGGYARPHGGAER